MGALCFEKKSREKMLKELLKGKEYANQLQVLLQTLLEEDGLVSAEDLVVKILTSFTQTLSELSSCSSDDDYHHHRDQNLQQQASSCNVNSDGRHLRSEDSGESKKRPGLKDRRGCYKRKKNTQTWTIVSSTIEDGHAWRKYGQKKILDANYPRSYFRCTHKYVQGCRATKQVQRRDDDPQKYEITFIGHHTCRDIASFSQIVTENSDPNWSSASTAASGGSYVVSSSSSNIPTTEVKQETTSTDDQDLSDYLSSLGSIGWEEDFVPFQSSDEPQAAAAAMVLSCNKTIYSHCSLDMYNDFEHGFDHFDEYEFF